MLGLTTRGVWVQSGFINCRELLIFVEFSACGARLGKAQNREPMLGSQLVFLHLGNVSSVHYGIWERKLLSAVRGHCSLLQTVSVSLLKDGDRHSRGVCGKRTSLRARLKYRQQRRTIAALKKQNQMSSPNYIAKAQNIPAYPADTASIKCRLPCRCGCRSSTTGCMIWLHTDWVFRDTLHRAACVTSGDLNSSSLLLTPDTQGQGALAHQQYLDHPSCSLGSSPLNNSSYKFISLPESQNTKWIQLRQRQSVFTSLTLTPHE